MSSQILKVYNIEGSEVSTKEHSFFDVKMNDDLLTQVMRVYMTNQHQGTKSTKTRGEVAGPDNKPWAQKGTGRARHGSNKTPIWVGGGVALGPKSYQRRLTLPKKMRDIVMKYFIDTEVRAGALYLVDQKDSVKTKDTSKFIKTLDLFKTKVVLVLPQKEEELATAFRNQKNVTIRRAEQISPLDFYKKAHFVFSPEAYEILIKRITKNV